MPGLAKRKTTRRKAAKRSAPLKLSAVSIALPEKTTKAYAKKIKSYINNVQSFAKRAKAGKSNPARIRQLNSAMTAINQQFRKKNAINAQLITALTRLQNTLKGFSAAPKTLKGNVNGIFNYLRSNVRKDVFSFIEGLKKQIAPVYSQLEKLETLMNRQVKGAKNYNWAFRVDPAIRRQINSFNTQIKRFKTKWFKRLNRISLHGNKEVQRHVASLKNQINEMQKLVGRQVTIINAANRIKPTKTRKNVKNFLTKTEIKRHYNQFNRIEKALEQYRIPVESFVEQLRAVKTV